MVMDLIQVMSGYFIMHQIVIAGFRFKAISMGRLQRIGQRSFGSVQWTGA